MKRFITSIIAVALSLTVAFIAVGCFGGGNKYKQFVKKHGSYTNTIDVVSGTESKEFVMDNYSLYGQFQVSTNGSFNALVTEKTMSKGAEMGYYDDTKIHIEFTVRYYHIDDAITVNVARYKKWEGSKSLDRANGLGEMYEFTDGFSYNNTQEGNKFEFDANKYFDDNKLTLEDATTALTLSVSDVSSIITNKSLDDYLVNNPTWEEDAIADIIDAVNATLAEIDKFIEEEN